LEAKVRGDHSLSFVKLRINSIGKEDRLLFE
jgi:hypothetical protein